jgi:N-acetylglucosaminyldiphosphoundecaprenol N-acetyl-beta-D-mannosaminyltransferase
MKNHKFFSGTIEAITTLIFNSIKCHQINVDRADEIKPLIVAPVDLNALSFSKSDTYSKDFAQIDYLVPDGMPIVWWLKFIKKEAAQRIYGPTLQESVLKKCYEEPSFKHFFICSRPDKVDKMAEVLRRKYPYLNTILISSLERNGIDDFEELVNEIKDYNPHIVWIGVGTPTQIALAAKLKESKLGQVIIPVGAAFDFLTGDQNQAPKIIQNSGFEWLFRLLSNPARLWKRYLITVPLFLIRLSISTKKK